MRQLITWSIRLLIIKPIFAIGLLSLCPLEVDAKNQEYFTFGATISEVVAVQGKPDSVVVNSSQLHQKSKKTDTGFTYNYGKSQVHFDVDDGRVYSWRNHRKNPLKTSFSKDYLLLPKHFDTDKDYFTLGATEDEVIVIQGRPDYIWRTSPIPILGGTHRFVYEHVGGEDSHVEFENGRVSGWNIRTIPLKVKLVSTKTTVEKDYFTLGSTIDEVVAIQGTPDACRGDDRYRIVLYGSSKLVLENGRVSNWWNTDVNPLKVKFLPKRKTTKSDYFTLESTKDEVLAVQGTPDSFNRNTFYYGSSEALINQSSVYFRKDCVVGWESQNSNPLKTKPFSGECFTIGSSKEEVLAIQGIPDDRSDTLFRYGTAFVNFANNRVTGWETMESISRLKVQLLPSTNTPKKHFFRIGSTMDEVLSVQGTPDTYRHGRFVYGTFMLFPPDAYGRSYVEFENGRVTKWKNNLYNPLKVKESPD